VIKNLFSIKDSNPQVYFDKLFGVKAEGNHKGIEMFLRSFMHSRREPVEVKAGDRFCRRRRDQVLETASVLELRSEPLGIPHVLFDLTFEKPAIGQVEGGKRVLSLDSFIEAYHDRIV
jgi:hypothetical protein